MRNLYVNNRHWRWSQPVNIFIFMLHQHCKSNDQCEFFVMDPIASGHKLSFVLDNSCAVFPPLLSHILFSFALGSWNGGLENKFLGTSKFMSQYMIQKMSIVCLSLLLIIILIFLWFEHCLQRLLHVQRSNGSGSIFQFGMCCSSLGVNFHNYNAGCGDNEVAIVRIVTYLYLNQFIEMGIAMKAASFHILQLLVVALGFYIPWHIQTRLLSTCYPNIVFSPDVIPHRVCITFWW